MSLMLATALLMAAHGAGKRRAALERKLEAALALAGGGRTLAPEHQPLPPVYGPRGGITEIQSLLLPVAAYTPATAKGWAKAHGYRYGKVHTTANYHRLRQADPGAFRALRTITLGGPGIKAVVGLRTTRRRRRTGYGVSP